MPASIDSLTLAAHDVAVSAEFYTRVFGAKAERSGDCVTLDMGERASQLRLQQWDELAAQLGQDPATSGFRGFALSFIVATAEEVDTVLGRLPQSGGCVSKEPKNALWGYSAYATDPDGHHWKIASSKRHPLIGRPRLGGTFEPVAACETALTLGVSNMLDAKEFLATVGYAVKKDYKKFVKFDVGHGTSLGMYERKNLADDAGTDAQGDGFTGLMIGRRVQSPTDLRAVVDGAVGAGASRVRPGSGDLHDAEYLIDRDGFGWRIAG